ncbi:MAG: hypothetical protein AAFW98_10660, partial [Pseudomonadota bacterium]
QRRCGALRSCSAVAPRSAGVARAPKVNNTQPFATAGIHHVDMPATPAVLWNLINGAQQQAAE